MAADPEFDSAALRRLARSLVWDRERAGDLVQEAWLAALRSGQGARVSTGWLAAAVRRIALGRQRDDRRRNAREELAARPESLPAAAEACARLEVLRRLVEAVGRLEEPYRTVIVQRFFDALPPREIARRTGQPVNTVRTHVRRGLEHLRRDLDGPDARGREAFLSALVPLASPMPWNIALGLPPAASALSTSIGVALVNKSVIAAAGVLLALALGWFALRTPAVERPSTAETPVAVLETIEGPENPIPASPEVLEAVPEARAAVASVDAARTWVHHGRITSGPWDPLPHGRLHGRVLRGEELDGELLFEELFTADASGLFDWALEPPSEMVTVVFEADMEGYLCTPVWGTYAPGESSESLWTVYADPLDVLVTGRVCDTRGSPIPGARVIQRNYLRDREVSSDARGRFQIPLSSVHGVGGLIVVAAGFAAVHRAVLTAAPGASELHDVVLVSERRLRGRVVDESGTAVEGAEIMVHVPFGHATVESDAAGAFELVSLDPERDQSPINASKQGFTPGTVYVRADEDDVEIRLSRGASITGRVVSDSGTPLPHTHIALGEPYGRSYEPSVRTDSLGHFALAPVPTGTQHLWVTRDGFAQRRFDFEVPGSASSLQVGDISMETEHVLRGLVLGADGSPMPWAVVYVEDPRSRGSVGRIAGSQTHTGADGRFSIRGLPDLGLTVGVLADRHARLEQGIEGLAGTELVLRLVGSGSLAGLVLDAETGQAVQDFVVRLMPLFTESREKQLLGYSSSWSDGVAVHSEQGRWQLEEDVPPDRWISVQIEAEGFAPARIERVATAVDPDPQACVARLSRTTLLRGRVLRKSDGTPIAGARVVHLPSVDAHTPDKHSDEPALETLTDAAGRFELRSVPTGSMALAIEGPGIAPTRDGPFEVSGAGPVERWIEVAAGARLWGRLLDSDGLALAGESLLLRALDARTSQQEWTATTGERGAFEFAALPTGNYHVSWQRKRADLEYSDLTHLVNLESDSNLEFNLQPRGSAGLRGRLEYDGRLPALVVVRVSRTPTPPFDPAEADWARFGRATLAEDGLFVFDGLEPGKYHVMCFHTMESGTEIAGGAPVELAAGSEPEVVLDLKPFGSRAR